MLLASRADMVVIVVYLLLMVSVGFILNLFNKDDSDFFKSGNKMPWWLSGISLFMSTFSVYTFTGGAGLAYRAPMVGIVLYLTNGLAVIISVWFLASRWRRSRADTVMSYLSKRYGVSTNQLYSWTHLGVAIVQGGIFLLALGKFVSVAIGTDLQWTIVVCGAVISVYCLIGGLWAVVVTDTLQFMVLFPIAIVVLFLGIYEIGGITSLATRAPEGFWAIRTQEFDWFYILAYGIMMTFAMSSGAAAQRYFSVKTEREARKVAVMTMVLLMVAPAIWLIPPICTRLLGIDLGAITAGVNAPQEAAYVAFCLKYLPAGAMGILVAAMLSATMSSLSSSFNVYAAVITEDIVKQIFWKSASPKTLLVVGRLMTLVLGALVAIAAILQSSVEGGVFQLMMTFGGVIIVPAGIPLVFGLVYKRTPRWAALASFGSGLLIGVGYLLLDRAISFKEQIFFIGSISALVYFLPGLFIQARGAYRERLEEFFRMIETPIQPGEVGDTERTDVGSFRITGWTTVFMGAAAMLLVLLDLPLRERMINLAIAALIMVFGALLLLVCDIAQRRGRRRKAAGTAQATAGTG